jgi:hypothetical protein
VRKGEKDGPTGICIVCSEESRTRILPLGWRPLISEWVCLSTGIVPSQGGRHSRSARARDGGRPKRRTEDDLRSSHLHQHLPNVVFHSVDEGVRGELELAHGRFVLAFGRDGDGLVTHAVGDLDRKLTEPAATESGGGGSVRRRVTEGKEGVPKAVNGDKLSGVDVRVPERGWRMLREIRDVLDERRMQKTDRRPWHPSTSWEPSRRDPCR